MSLLLANTPSFMRAVWSGSLSFGLINIPVRLYSSSKDRSLSFTLLDKHGNCPISFMRVCRANHQEVPYEDIVKGYEYKKGDYVVLDENDFKRAAAKKSELIDIVQFSNTSDIESKYYEKPYYIEPDKKATKAYVLLRDALQKSKKAAIAKFVMREKEHIAAITVEDDILMLHQLRFEDEIRKPDITIPSTTKYSESELNVALALVKQLSKKFDPKKFHDTYTEELEEIIEAKAKGKRVKKAPQAAAPSVTQMKDLMRMLKMSLEKTEAH